MSMRQGFLGLVAVGLVAGQAAAQPIDQTSFLFRRPPAACATCGTPVTGQVTVVPADPDRKDQAPALDPQAFAQAPASGGEALTGCHITQPSHAPRAATALKRESDRPPGASMKNLG